MFACPGCLIFNAAIPKQMVKVIEDNFKSVK